MRKEISPQEAASFAPSTATSMDSIKNPREWMHTCGAGPPLMRIRWNQSSGRHQFFLTLDPSRSQKFHFFFSPAKKSKIIETSKAEARPRRGV
jgi:hypothetical protein